jgi:hypothetical protein
VTQVQQQIQVLAADQRNIEEQSRQLNQRREKLAADRNALAAPDEAGWPTCRRSSPRRRKAAETADARLHELQEQVPQLDEDRRAKQQSVNGESGKQADLSARMEALKALQEKVRTDGKLQPWLAKHGLGGAARPLDPHPHRAGLGKRAGGCAARAHAFAGDFAARHGACVRERRAAGPARLLQPAGRERAGSRGRLAAPGRPAAPERRRPEGFGCGLAARLLHRGQTSRTPWPRATSCSPAK